MAQFLRRKAQRMAQEKPVSTAPKDPSGEKPLRIRRGRVDSVDLYEIKESELDLLEKGSPTGLFLNFGIFLFSIAFSAIAALCTATTFKLAIMKTVFVVVVVVGLLLGALLLILWKRGRVDVVEVIKGIRDRIPAETQPAPPCGSDAGILPSEQTKIAEPKG